MKKTSWFAAFALVSVGVLAGSAASRPDASRLRLVDDPPPEPVTCPLCGGDPMVHVQKTFAICTTAADFMTIALRW